MHKILAAVLATGFLTSTTQAFGADCKSLKVSAANTLSQVCANTEALSSDQVTVVEELVMNLMEICADPRISETFERGILYKKLDLYESCATNAALLTKLAK